MFTVCPKCTLTLVVTTVDLRAGQGYVRCGRCANVFNALIALREGEPDGNTSDTAKRRLQETAPNPPSNPAVGAGVAMELEPEPAQEPVPEPPPEPLHEPTRAAARVTARAHQEPPQDCCQNRITNLARICSKPSRSRWWNGRQRARFRGIPAGVRFGVDRRVRYFHRATGSRTGRFRNL